MVSLNAQKKIQKNGKKTTPKLKFIDRLSDLADNIPEIYKKNNAKHVRKEKKSNQYSYLLGLYIIHCVTNAKNVKKDG